MNNSKSLIWNELFIQRIPPKTINYQFLLAKTDFFWNNELILEYHPPLSKKYNYDTIHSENKNNEIAK